MKQRTNNQNRRNNDKFEKCFPLKIIKHNTCKLSWPKIQCEPD